MKNKCDINNIGVLPVNIDRIYDFSRAINTITSNMPIKFEILCDRCLPCNTKIEITKTTFKYNLNKIEKTILINGHKIDDISTGLEDRIYLENKYINLVNKDCKELIFSITEHVRANFEINAYIKGIAYIDNCKKVCFEAYGKGIDKINNIIISNAYVPNFIKSIEPVYLNFKTEIIGSANPEYIFVSPIYNCDTSIENLLANIFVNYCIGLDLTTLIPSDLNLLILDNKKKMHKPC